MLMGASVSLVSMNTTLSSDQNDIQSAVLEALFSCDLIKSSKFVVAMVKLASTMEVKTHTFYLHASTTVVLV